MAWVIAPGKMDYFSAWNLQEQLLSQRIAGQIGNAVIVCEHDPVITVGRRRGAFDNVLDDEGIAVLEVERGGDATWHGPGQLVAYPIVALEGPQRDLHAWMHRLEQLMIDVCADFGLAAGRDPRNTGAWVNGRKLGQIGVACRKWVTWHGLSLNVAPDLAGFRRIRPCGMDVDLVTTMERELGAPVDFEAVRLALIRRVIAW